MKKLIALLAVCLLSIGCVSVVVVTEDVDSLNDVLHGKVKACVCGKSCTCKGCVCSKVKTCCEKTVCPVVKVVK